MCHVGGHIFNAGVQAALIKRKTTQNVMNSEKRHRVVSKTEARSKLTDILCHWCTLPFNDGTYKYLEKDFICYLNVQNTLRISIINKQKKNILWKLFHQYLGSPCRIQEVGFTPSYL